MSRTAVCLALTCLLGLSGQAASTGLFPKLRQRMEAQRKLSLAQNASIPEGPVEVPPAMDVDANGFPVLPAVDQILGGAAVTLKSVGTQASDIAGRMAAAQKQEETELAKQKGAYEQNLKAQEEKNQAVAVENKHIMEEIDTLKKQNIGLRKKAHEIQKKNSILRSAVHALDSKMGSAKEFAHKSMAETDDSKQAVLKVLQVHRSKTALISESDDDEKDDEDYDDEDDDYYDDEDESKEDQDETQEAKKATSFLAVSSKVQRGAKDSAPGVTFDMAMIGVDVAGMSQQSSMLDNTDPDSILQTLSKDINTLMLQRKQSVTNLKNLFIRDFRAGAKRGVALLNQQKQLIARRTELLNLQKKLKEADAHLEVTHKQLGRRLHGLGQFLQKLSHVANAPEAEVTNLLDSMPKSVSIASKAQ